jgi:cystathionine gamma-synthase
MSIHLHPHMCQRAFYDGLDVAKGPSLGTNFTLICPYTLLAHYHELDFALSCNVPPNLIRIAVGLEDFDVLKARFEAALARSRLHLKLPMTKKSS